MEKCSDVMTGHPVCCLPDDNVVRVAQLMKGKDIGAVPVVQNEMTKKLVGIVTDRDLALKVVAVGLDPKTVIVEDVLTRNIVTCQADDDLEVALDAMSRHQLRRIPVVDHEYRIVGIIAQADVATRTNQPEKTAEVVKEISM